MKAIGIVSTKGGSGKSTLTTHLAAFVGEGAAIADCDPQGSSALWYNARTEPHPQLVQMKPSELRKARWPDLDWLFVDSAPAHSEDVRVIADFCDFVIIPTRPQIFDLDGIRTAVNAVKRGAILLNACPPGRGYKEGSVTMDARRALEGAPLPVAPVSVTQRATFAHALISGAAAHEFEPDGKAAREIREVWEWLKDEA